MLIACPECGKQYSDTSRTCPHCGYNSYVAQMRDDPTKLGYRHRPTAILIALFLGLFGGHCFYEGKNIKGVFYAFTLGGFIVGWLWDLFDLIVLTKDEWYNPKI